MSISEVIVKICGIVLVVVGLALVLSAVGVNFLGVALAPIWLAVLIGVIFIGAGIMILRGGAITL